MFSLPHVVVVSRYLSTGVMNGTSDTKDDTILPGSAWSRGRNAQLQWEADVTKRVWRVWYNRGTSTVYDQLRLFREADSAGEFCLLASTQPGPTPLSVHAHELFEEPGATISDDSYVDWCRRMCHEREVDLLVPGRRREAIAREAASFAPTIVDVPATAERMHRLERKASFYEEVSADDIPVPRFRAFRTLAEYDRARAELDGLRLCVKPDVGIFASGFYQFVPSLDEYARMANSISYRLQEDTFRCLLAEARDPLPYLLMEYLPGQERSVDCLASRGELVAAVSRVKQDGVQITETEGPAIEIARKLVAKFSLNSIINVQTRDDEHGVTRVLEVNARPSGGLPFAALAGLAYPYWAAKLALSLARPADVPRPRAGVIIASVTAAVVLG